MGTAAAECSSARGTWRASDICFCARPVADRQLVSERWIALARTPGLANPNYGFTNWYLNTDRKSLPTAPESAVTFCGNGQNIIYIDWENDLVVVVRWIKSGDALDTFLGKVLASLNPAAATR